MDSGDGYLLDGVIITGFLIQWNYDSREIKVHCRVDTGRVGGVSLHRCSSYMEWTPLFTKEVVLRMIAALEGISVKLRHVKERDVFGEADENDVYHTVYPEYIQTREGLKTLYPIGNQSWPWEEVETKTK